MTVKEYALQQLHFLIREDPWVREIFLAAGLQLDALAERILAIYYQDTFSELTEAQCAYYEGLLGLSPGGAALEPRRAAIQAAWQAESPPTLQAVQAVCDSWASGLIKAGYTAAELLLRLQMTGRTWQTVDLDEMLAAVERIKPAHLALELDVASELAAAPLYVGVAGYFAARADLHVAGDDPAEYTILTDEDGAWLIDEVGGLLFDEGSESV